MVACRNEKFGKSEHEKIFKNRDFSSKVKIVTNVYSETTTATIFTRLLFVEKMVRGSADTDTCSSSELELHCVSKVPTFAKS